MTTSAVHQSSSRFPTFAVPWPVLLVAGLMFAGLMALSGSYGFHGDEMYYVVAGQHPAFGYVDQPPLTPLLSAASVALFGASPTAVRTKLSPKPGSTDGLGLRGANTTNQVPF